MGVGKERAGGDKAVERWRLDIGITHEAEVLVIVVVGDQQDDVRLFRRICRSMAFGCPANGRRSQ